MRVSAKADYAIRAAVELAAAGLVGPVLRAIVWSYFPVAGLWYLACVVSLVLSYRHAADGPGRDVLPRGSEGGGLARLEDAVDVGGSAARACVHRHRPRAR